mmetsp:Transcript_35606/g.84372  ORF Transcript_35606/g.84372 Transcript_35606/m.84372 type:complete len:190 (+) Transcript_35606:450-1019(+)
MNRTRASFFSFCFSVGRTCFHMAQENLIGKLGGLRQWNDAGLGGLTAVSRQILARLFFHTQSSLHWFMREKEGDGSTYSCLTQLAQHNNIDLLVVGNIGRTQSKQETAKKDLGHIAESVWRLCQSSVCVVKSSSYDLDIERGATWLVAADGGHAAMMAFCYVIFRSLRGERGEGCRPKAVGSGASPLES